MIRAFQITFLGCLALFLIGCKGHERIEPEYNQVKIGDIAPSHKGKQQTAELLNTVSFDVHIFEIPSDNIIKLSDAWRMLYIQPLRFTDYNAFQANSFIVRFGQISALETIHDLLLAAGGQKIVTVSLLLPDSQAIDLAVTGLNKSQSISFIAADGIKQGATIGPGILVLRMQAEQVPESKSKCNLIAYPVFTTSIRSSIPELAARAKFREFQFSSAAFGLKMGPGDFIMLGPEKYIDDQLSLGSLFFSKPEGSLFFSPEHGAPKVKTAVRIFLLVCSRINY
jgi:hypothetical protein